MNQESILSISLSSEKKRRKERDRMGKGAELMKN